MRTIITIVIVALAACGAKQKSSAPVKPATAASHPGHMPVAQR